jgi:hypothetical protein
MKQRMQDYFQTMWSLNHGIDIHEVREVCIVTPVAGNTCTDLAITKLMSVSLLEFW